MFSTNKIPIIYFIFSTNCKQKKVQQQQNSTPIHSEDLVQALLNNASFITEVRGEGEGKSEREREKKIKENREQNSTRIDASLIQFLFNTEVR
jgi:hypothetical protein